MSPKIGMIFLPPPQLPIFTFVLCVVMQTKVELSIKSSGLIFLVDVAAASPFSNRGRKLTGSSEEKRGEIFSWKSGFVMNCEMPGVK